MRRRLVTIGFLLTLVWGILLGLPTVARADIPVLYVQVPQWTDDWAVCAVAVSYTHLTLPTILLV